MFQGQKSLQEKFFKVHKGEVTSITSSKTAT